MKLKILAPIMFLAVASVALAQGSSPRLFRTRADVERAQAQIEKYPAMAASRDALAVSVNEKVNAWKKQTRALKQQDTGAWLAFGAKMKRPPLPDVMDAATLYAVQPDAKLGAVIREQLLASAGMRRARGTWREIGIHESQRMLEFLKACDLMRGTGVLSNEEENVLRQEICRSGTFFEAWLLDFPATATGRGETYCLNICLYPASVLGAIALYYPDYPESKRWLQLAEEQIVKYLMTDFALDGGYGEGSAHYFQPCIMAILEFMNASKNAGAHDYSKDAAVVAQLKRALAWRTDLMGPDGRTTAIGDAHREQIGAADMELAALMLDDPDLAWTGRRMIESAKRREQGAAYMETTHDLLVTDLSREARAPGRIFSNYPWSGYLFSRSGWGMKDNYIMFKYGPTWIGRRQSENVAVISGHAHEDALQIELHHAGLPVLVDPGYKGVYADYLRYGGYWKATIAHNTVGLGNEYGYERRDGLYNEHVNKHGADFLYEQVQKVISPADYDILAAGDAGAATLASVSARTFEDVTHRRTLVWLRDSSLTLVADHLESGRAQPYEWYLNPAGRLLKKGGGDAGNGAFVFGNERVKLSVVPVNLSGARTQIIQQGDASVPPYYASLGKDYKGPDGTDGPDGYWASTSLMIESVRAKSADFLHVLAPHAGAAPSYEESAMGSRGKKLSAAGTGDVILVSAAGNDDRTLSVDAGAGFVRMQKGEPSLFALLQGTRLDMDGGALVYAKLKGNAWASRYAVSLTALVSLADKRASIGLPPPPMERGLLLKRIDSTEGREVAAVEIEVSFKVGAKPARMILAQSMNVMPDLARAPKEIVGVSRSTSLRLREREAEFSYDGKSGMVTVIVPAGISQLVWE